MHSSEPAGLAGVRFFGQNDWYRLGAEEIVKDQKKFPDSGKWAVRKTSSWRRQLCAALPGQGACAGT